MSVPSLLPPSPEARVEELRRKLAAMADASVRVDYLRSVLGQGEAGELADLLQAAAEAADAGVPGYADTLLFLGVALAPARLEPLRRSLARAAIARGHGLARSLLVPESRVDSPRNEGADRPPRVAPGVRPPTLGERKSLARGSSRTTLDRVLLDPHPDVIRILLANPLLREIDVLRLAAKRPVAAEVLREILTHERWFTRYGVRHALVQNPWLPTDLGLLLVRQLHRQDAEALIEATELPESIREAARREARRVALH